MLIQATDIVPVSKHEADNLTESKLSSDTEPESIPVSTLSSDTEPESGQEKHVETPIADKQEGVSPEEVKEKQSTVECLEPESGLQAVAEEKHSYSPPADSEKDKQVTDKVVLEESSLPSAEKPEQKLNLDKTSDVTDESCSVQTAVAKDEFCSDNLPQETARLSETVAPVEANLSKLTESLSDVKQDPITLQNQTEDADAFVSAVADKDMMTHEKVSGFKAVTEIVDSAVSDQERNTGHIEARPEPLPATMEHLSTQESFAPKTEKSSEKETKLNAVEQERKIVEGNETEGKADTTPPTETPQSCNQQGLNEPSLEDNSSTKSEAVELPLTQSKDNSSPQKTENSNELSLVENEIAKVEAVEPSLDQSTGDGSSQNITELSHDSSPAPKIVDASVSLLTENVATENTEEPVSGPSATVESDPIESVKPPPVPSTDTSPLTTTGGDSNDCFTVLENETSKSDEVKEPLVHCSLSDSSSLIEPDRNTEERELDKHEVKLVGSQAQSQIQSNEADQAIKYDKTSANQTEDEGEAEKVDKCSVEKENKQPVTSVVSGASHGVNTDKDSEVSPVAVEQVCGTQTPKKQDGAAIEIIFKETIEDTKLLHDNTQPKDIELTAHAQDLECSVPPTPSVNEISPSKNHEEETISMNSCMVCPEVSSPKDPDVELDSLDPVASEQAKNKDLEEETTPSESHESVLKSRDEDEVGDITVSGNVPSYPRHH